MKTPWWQWHMKTYIHPVSTNSHLVVKHHSTMPRRIVNDINVAQNVQKGLQASAYTSSAWFKTMVDPAHARDYSCKGIPDENQQPSLCYYGRDTISVSASYPITKRYLWNQSTREFDEVNGGVFSSIHSVTIMQTGLITRPYLLIFYGTASSGELTNVPTYAFEWISGLVETSDSTMLRPARLIASSVTADFIGAELNRGGYYESGYAINSAIDMAGTNTLNLTFNNLANLVTNTNSAQDGVYAVSKFNNYEQYKTWKNKVSKLSAFMTVSPYAGSTTDERQLAIYTGGWAEYSEYFLPYPTGDFTPLFITYYTNSEVTGTSDWILRFTVNEVVEIMTPYRMGGTDAALYDPATVEDLRHLYDDYDLIFPARYNDLKMIMAWLMRNIRNLPSFFSSLRRHFPGLSFKSALGAVTGIPAAIRRQRKRQAGQQLRNALDASYLLPTNPQWNQPRVQVSNSTAIKRRNNVKAIRQRKPKN